MWESIWSEIYEMLSVHLESTFNHIYQNYFDIYYARWLAWIFYPLVVTFLLPVVIVLFIYASALFLQLYRLRHHFLDVYHMDFWNGARQIIAALWDAQGKIWHGYEIQGFDRIPETGPALIVFYHGALPIDFYYLMANVILHKKRQIRVIGDRFLFRIPGFKLLMEVFCVQQGSVSSCVEQLREGHLMGISPGGVREAQFGDEHYKLIWGNRVGFAKIAIEAKVPIIPMFTQNVRETFRTLSLGKGWLRKFYEATRLPCVPIYGGFPVKMRTFIGEPIEFHPEVSPEQLSIKVQRAVEQLIREHQTIPGNIFRGLCERFYTPPNDGRQS